MRPAAHLGTTFPPSGSGSHREIRRDASLKPSDYFWIAFLWILTEALRYFFCLVLIIGATALAVAQSNCSGSIFVPGEVLQYKVKWGFFRLGTLVVTQDAADSASVQPPFVTMNVHSASGLPFISVHLVNKSRKGPSSLWVTEELMFAGKDSSERASYRYDPATGYVHAENVVTATANRSVDSLRVSGFCYDALGLFMFTRSYGSTKGTIVVPTLIESSIQETELSFTGELEEIEVAACDKPVRSRRFEGTARWEGHSFAGMKGPFTGWISDDDASIPLRAELQIFLGSIVLELESTNRKDWRPNRLASF